MVQDDESDEDDLPPRKERLLTACAASAYEADRRVSAASSGESHPNWRWGQLPLKEVVRWAEAAKKALEALEQMNRDFEAGRVTGALKGKKLDYVAETVEKLARETRFTVSRANLLFSVVSAVNATLAEEMK